MSGSPDAVLYDLNGNALAVQNGTTIPASTPSLMIAGSDGTNSRYVTIDTSGRLVVAGAGTAGTPTGGVVSIQGVASGTVVPVSGTVAATQSGSWSVTASDAQTAESTAAWTSATALNTTLSINVSGYATIAVTLNQGSTITGGAATFEVSDTVAGTNWYPITLANTAGASIPSSVFPFSASQNQALQMNIAGFVLFRVRLSTVISGTGTINVGIAASSSAAEWMQSVSITDGAHGPATVKAASIAAVVTDPALVVAVSPNNTVAVTQSTSPWADNITQFGGVNISTGTGASGTGIPRVTVSNDSNVLATQSGAWTVQPGNTANTTPWLATINQGGNSAGVVAKGTQASNALAVQNLKDSGRVSFSAVCSATTGVTTEALISLTPVRTVTAGSAATTLAVTAGKTLRLQALVLSVRNTSTTQASAIIRVRMLAGTVLVSSQEMFSVACTAGSALSGGTASATLIFPDGFEISGTTQVGISQLCSSTSSTIDVALIGYEY